MHAVNSHRCRVHLSRYIPRMDAMDRVIAEMSPDDTAVALRLLKVPEECGEVRPVEAGDWGRRIVGWAAFSSLEVEAAPSA